MGAAHIVLRPVPHFWEMPVVPLQKLSSPRVALSFEAVLAAAQSSSAYQQETAADPSVPVILHSRVGAASAASAVEPVFPFLLPE